MTAAPEAGALARDGGSYDLSLFVSGASGLSARAIYDVRQLCDEHLAAPVHLSVVDGHDAPELALSSGVSVVPALVRTRPRPVRRVVGDLSQTEHVLSMLRLADVGDVANG